MNSIKIRYFLIVLLSVSLFWSCQTEQKESYVFSVKLDTAYPGLSSEELTSLLEDGKILVTVFPIENQDVVILDLKDYYTIKDNKIIIQFQADVPVTDNQVLSVLLAKENSKKKIGYDLYFAWANYFNGETNLKFNFETLFSVNGNIKFNEDSLRGAELIAYSSIKSSHSKIKRLFRKKYNLEDENFNFNFVATNFFNDSILEKLPEFIDIQKDHFNTFFTVKKDNKIGFALPSKAKGRDDFIKNNRKFLGDEAVCFAKDLICKTTKECDNLCTESISCFNSPEVEIGKSIMSFYENNLACVSSQIGDLTPGKNINLDINLYETSKINDKVDFEHLEKSALITSVYVNSSVENLNTHANGDIKSRMGVDFKNKTIVLGSFYISGFNLHHLFINPELTGAVKNICKTQPKACNSELYKNLKDKELKATIKIEYENYYIKYDGIFSLYTVSSILGQSTFKDNIQGWVLQNRYPFYTIYNNDDTPYESNDEIIDLDRNIKKVTIITDFSTKVIEL
jgi:hypothetical protein